MLPRAGYGPPPRRTSHHAPPTAGDIDCGGLEYALIRYGSFFEFVLPLRAGHLSVGVEPAADPVALGRAICALPSVAEVRA